MILSTFWIYEGFSDFVSDNFRILVTEFTYCQYDIDDIYKYRLRIW